MRKILFLVTIALFFILEGCVVAPPKSTTSGEESNPWKFLPTRVLEIDGGSVAFQSALIVDLRRSLKNPMLQDYPTKYILPITNKSSHPIWVEAEWRVPGKEPFVSFGKLKPKQYGEFYWKVDDIVWNTPIPVKVNIYADKNKSNLLGMNDVVLQFPEGKDKEQFLLKAKEVNSIASKMGHTHGHKAEAPLLSGFEVTK